MKLGRNIRLLTENEWRPSSDAHRARVRRWTEPCRERRARGASHPVHDFLFTYYSYPMGRLERWHGGVACEYEWPYEGDGWQKRFAPRDYECLKGVVRLRFERLTSYRKERLGWIKELLEATAGRSGNYGCYGLHEWAMVYGAEDIRHRETVPLRLPQGEVDRVVNSRKLCCTHFDAYRFFVAETQPMNRFEPSLERRPELEQPGCLHANMDLFKWAYKALPWISSELVWKCFNLALVGRELDMRASPYDLSEYGYEPIKIETVEGRQIYEKRQRELAQDAAPLRQELTAALAEIVNW